MDMTNREAHSHESNSLEHRLQRYGNTLDARVDLSVDPAPQRATTEYRRQHPSTELASASFDLQTQTRPKRKTHLLIGTAVAGASALILSLISFGGTSGTTIVTADGRTPKRLVDAAELKAAYSAAHAQSTMVFPLAQPASFVNTFGAPRMTGTPLATRHDGIDIFGAPGASVYAMTGGVVRLRSFDVKPMNPSSKTHGGLQTNPTPWNHNSSTFDAIESSPDYHLQFIEVTQVDSTVVVYSNLEPIVADKQEIRVGQFIGTLTASSPMVQPPNLHIAQYSPGPRLKDSLPFIPVSPDREYRASNIYPLLTSLLPTPGQATLPIEVQGISVSSAIAPRLRSLLDAAKADGFTNISGSGYRSPTTQIAFRKAHCGTTDFDIYLKPSSQCKPPTMRPGTSDHERGVAVDFSHNGQIVKADEPFARWLTKRAADYGFSGVADEPWHWSADTFAPIAMTPEVGATIGQLEIKSAQIKTSLIEGAGPEQLKVGAGREHLSAALGEAGETVIRCHRTAYGAPCLNLDRVKLGDKISLRAKNTVFEYTVRTVGAHDNSPEFTMNMPNLKGHALLTITTNHPKYSARQILLVQAELSGLTTLDGLVTGAS
jgi:LPXTG-site transpeptidase (sortase) family protein